MARPTLSAVRPIRWQPGLDGLRALAVAAVIAYHLDPEGVPGGFLGVSVFFTLSGYLITSLLIDETHRTGRISLRDFWTRRARRLWPLAWTTLAAVGLLALAGAYDDIGGRLIGEIASALGQFANWWQLAHEGYVNQFGRPSPLRHMWSLAIEEQFYIVWPAVVWVLRGRRRPLILVSVLGILGSIAVTVFLADTPDRVYLGTDTRAAELLVGALLALLWSRHPLRGPRDARARRWCDAAGAIALGSLVPLVALLHPDDDAWGWGAFAAVAIGSAALAAASVTNGDLRPLLSWKPLVWVGRRSYGLYLIHWPLWVAMPIEWPFATRVVVTVVGSLVLPALAHRLVEQPVRERKVPRRALVAAGVVAVGAMFGGAAVAASSGPSAQEKVTETLDRATDPTTTMGSTTTIPCPTTTLPAPTTTLPGDEGYKATLGTLVDPQEILEVASCGRPVRVLVLGDSTARGLANGLIATGRQDLQVWDRSVLSCSVGGEVGSTECPDWRSTWRAAVGSTRPDVVVLMMIPLADLDGVDVSAERFESEAEAQRRVDVLMEAMEIAGSSGATVAWARAPHIALPNGLYYCKGKRTESICDPAWIELWNQAADTATVFTGSKVIDTPAWAQPRPQPLVDRPDGVHFTGQALAELANWVAPQLVAMGRR